MATQYPYIQQPTTSGQPAPKPAPLPPLSGNPVGPAGGSGLLINPTLAQNFSQQYGAMNMPAATDPKTPLSPGVRATAPTNNLVASPNTIDSKYQAPVTNSYSSLTSGSGAPSQISGYSRQGNDVYDPSGAYVSFEKAQQLGIVPYLAQIPQKSTSGTSGVGGAVGSSDGLPQQKNDPNAPYTVNNGLYGQLITGLANKSNQPSEDYLKQQAEANRYNEALKNSQMQQAQGVADINNTGMSLDFKQGRGQILQQQYLDQQKALGSAFQGASSLLGAANTQQGLQQSGLTSAAGFAQPQVVGYGQQMFNPLTGSFSGGDLQSTVGLVAQKVNDGTMTYADAQNALSGYGQGGQNALLQALGSNFNVAQSNALAGQQGTIGPAMQYATTALSNLQSLVGQLGLAQGTNIPAVNSIGNWLSQTFGVGSQQTQAYHGALAEARQAIQSVLASVRGGTPSEYVGQSLSMLPDNATPPQIQAAIENLQALGSAKQQIYGNPGLSGGSSGGQVVQTAVGAINTNW